MVLLIEAGAIRVMCKYIELKKNRWYYRRRVPDDVQHLHRHPATKKPQGQLYFSLKTADKNTAAKLADSYTRRLDALWKADRGGSGHGAEPLASIATLERAGLQPGDGERHRGEDVITSFVDSLVGQYEQGDQRPIPSRQDRLTIDILNGGRIPRSLTDAKEKHFALGKGPTTKVGQQQFDRAWNLLLDIAGDVTLDSLRRDHVNQLISSLVERGNSGQTIKRYLSQVRPVITTGIREFELAINNQFDGAYIPNLGEASKPRFPYSTQELLAIHKRCRQIGDERRWAILMLSDTGARLAELVGLRKSDVFLEATIPHIHVTPTPDRPLKTKQSDRLIPLVGDALRACRYGMATDGPMLFPVFGPKKHDGKLNPSTASASLNKWLKENDLAGEHQVIHSLRHTMRDRLRNVETPSDMINFIGGWKRDGVGESYGKGYSLEVMQKFMLKIVSDPNTSG